MIKFDHVYYKKSSVDTMSHVAEDLAKDNCAFNSTDDSVPMKEESKINQEHTISSSESMNIPIDKLSEIVVSQDMIEIPKEDIFPASSTVSHLDILDSLEMKILPSWSDPGYDSGLSVSSPSSDRSSSELNSLLGDSFWEDSFSELFPSLV